MRFLVVGAGAVGGVVGGRLQQHGHEVVFVARGDHGAVMSEHGLRLVSPERDDRLTVEVVASPDQLHVVDGDVVLLTVKSQDTDRALGELATAAGVEPPVVCLQNGVRNEREALRRFRHVYGATVMCPTVHLEPGEVRAYSSPTTGIIDVGRFPTDVDENVATVVEALSRSTFSSQARVDIERWKWAKLVTNLGNAIEAVCGPPARRGLLGDVVRVEAEAVLAAAGVEFASEEEDRGRRGDHLHVQPIAGEARPGGSSWQSLTRGSGTIETDYLNGEIVMLGRLHGVPTPVNEALVFHARRLATARAEPGSVSEQAILELR